MYTNPFADPGQVKKQECAFGRNLVASRAGVLDLDPRVGLLEVGDTLGGTRASCFVAGEDVMDNSESRSDAVMPGYEVSANTLTTVARGLGVGSSSIMPPGESRVNNRQGIQILAGCPFALVDSLSW